METRGTITRSTSTRMRRGGGSSDPCESSGHRPVGRSAPPPLDGRHLGDHGGRPGIVADAAAGRASGADGGRLSGASGQTPGGRHCQARRGRDSQIPLSPVPSSARENVVPSRHRELRSSPTTAPGLIPRCRCHFLGRVGGVILEQRTPRSGGQAMTATHATITLNNGVELPALGFGVFQTPPDVDPAAVDGGGLRGGYRMIDTAASYGNEREVGAGDRRRAALPRGSCSSKTKLWVSDYGYDAALHAFDVSTAQARPRHASHLDLLHQPLPNYVRRHGRRAYRASERLLADGPGARDRRLQLQRGPPRDGPAPRPTVVPAVNQVEVHPFYSQPRAARGARAARHRDAGVVAAGRCLRLSARPTPSALKNRAGRTGHHGVAERHGKRRPRSSFAWHIEQRPLRDPQVGPARADR